MTDNPLIIYDCCATGELAGTLPALLLLSLLLQGGTEIALLLVLQGAYLAFVMYFGLSMASMFFNAGRSFYRHRLR